MRFINATLGVLALALAACAGADIEGVEYVEGEELIGSMGQPIFMPTNYGTESSTAALVCAPPWEGGVCKVPDNKHIKIGFQAGTCDTWYQTRVFNGHATWQFWINNLGDDWGTSTGSNYQIQCGTIGVIEGRRPMAIFSSNPSGTDTHPTEHGTLLQYSKGTIVIDPANILLQSGWGNLTEQQKQRVVENAVKHELGHLTGFGHEPGANTLMGTAANYVTTVYSYNSSMTSRAQCYNEDSGSGDDC